MSKTAILLGATGLTGGILLDFLLKDNTFHQVKLFSRSPVVHKDPKIEEHLIDMFNLEEQSDSFTGDVVFCCIGTTQANTPDKETYRKIDYGIPVTAATLAKQNGIDIFVVISAMGADVKSSIFYNRTKGEMERDVLQQGIPNTYILQPSLIGGDRDEKRTGERMAQFFMGTFGFLIPKKYKIIQPETIAKAMQRLSKTEAAETRITSDRIKEIANA
ncbi:NAD(P)H-binding protein [Altibacter sp.]|uniref:NAD(P)H-binding protein n=1 Tax=Altibacter sp. TaxID=2024823 RepID=UPI000C8F4043|nr:NAD(P)H-binding protein [Altibacter sp.]MAP55753.1 nucleoside-diphosphate sugar epimerase [Altibacter sp.]